MKRFTAIPLLLCVGLAGCDERTPAPAESFVNKVWQVDDSPTGAAGQLYVFLSEGTLVISSPHGRPAFGEWRQETVGLTLVEEGVAYRTEILEQRADRLRLRSHNPGGTLDINLKPAER